MREIGWRIKNKVWGKKFTQIMQSMKANLIKISKVEQVPLHGRMGFFIVVHL